jgi:hypothetical protein
VRHSVEYLSNSVTVRNDMQFSDLFLLDLTIVIIKSTNYEASQFSNFSTLLLCFDLFHLLQVLGKNVFNHNKQRVLSKLLPVKNVFEFSSHVLFNNDKLMVGLENVFFSVSSPFVYSP